MYTAPLTIFLVLIACTEHTLAHGKQIVHENGKHHSHLGRKNHLEKAKHGRKQMSKISGSLAEPHFPKKTLKHSKSRRKSHFEMDMKKVDKILAIKDNNEFTRKVFQMMKDDDSDVLKDIDEDEEPMIFLNVNNKFKKAKSRPSKRKSNSSKKKFAENVKRNFITQSPLNTTVPNNGFDYLHNGMMMQSQESPQSSQSQSMESLSQAQLSSQSIQVPQSQESMLSQQESQQPMQSLDHGAAEAANNDHPDLTKSKDIISKASRVCKPGPPLASTKRLPNCLLIGDSITLGSSYAVAAALQTKCTVQMSPFSKAGCALDSRYGLQCIQFLLSTTNLSPTRYDVIIFNFGMHDINFSDKFPEEFNDEKSYARNLGRIKKILLKTGAGIAFSLTTPVPYNVTKNDMIIKYNKIASSVMSKSPSIDTIDLYSYVINICGKVPFYKCFMMRRPNDVHYGLKGSILLGKQIAAKIVELLKEKNLLVKSGYSLPESAKLAKPLFTDLKEDSIKCSTNATVPTRCPSETTCMKNAISRSGYACCLLENAVDCKDNFHCCPENTVCHEKCSPSWCSCVSK